MNPEERRRLGWALAFVVRKYGADSDVRAVCHAVERYLLTQDQTHHQTHGCGWTRSHGCQSALSL
jgi:hypothetical protein